MNLASRLEAHTKVAQRPILIDGVTRAVLNETLAVEALGTVPIRGKLVAVDVFSVTVPQPR